MRHRLCIRYLVFGIPFFAYFSYVPIAAATALLFIGNAIADHALLAAPSLSLWRVMYRHSLSCSI